MTSINKLSCTFHDPDTESAFRSWSLPQDRSRARIAILASIPVVLLYVRADYLLFGTGGPFLELVFLRALFAVYSVAALVALSRTRTGRSIDRLVLFWAILSAVALVFVGSTRPTEYTGHLIMEVVAVFFVAAVLPNRFYYQLTAAGLLALGTMVVAVMNGYTADPALGTVVWSKYAISLGFGGFVSWDSHLSRRRLFAAMREVRTLRGLIPMCSNCRRVRDTEGAWRQFEAYLRERTDAEITHGYCPDCYATVTQELT